MQEYTNRIKDISLKIKELIDSSPISELEQYIHALIQSMLTKMELVSREEFDTQAALLARTQQQLVELQAQVSLLEQAQASSFAKK